MLKRIKQTVLSSVFRSGAGALLAGSDWRRKRLLILCYHGISIDDEHQWDPSLFMSADRFAERMELLRSGGYNVLPLRTAMRQLREGTLPSRAVVITFDDGNYDFHARALPIVRRYGYPVTLYLTTYYCRDQRPVFDMACNYILWKGRDHVLAGAELTGDVSPFPLRTPAERLAAFLRIRRFTDEAGYGADEKDRLLAALCQALKVDYRRINDRRILYLMSPDEVRDIARAGVDVQLHTHRHRTPRDRELFLREVRDNRSAINGILGERTTEDFCYPSGDYDPMFLPWLRAEGVSTGTTCLAGFATRETEPLLLPRMLDSSSLSNAEFEGWVSGFSAFLPRRAG